MGAGGIPSGGVVKVFDGNRLPAKTEHINSRCDLYVGGRRKQSRWYDANGFVVRNRDYFHSDPKGNHKFPHDHMWKVENGELIRISTNLDPDYDHFYFGREVSSMDNKYNPHEYNNAVPCEVCGGLTFVDDYGNSGKCPHCGWMQCADNERTDKTLGISYPMLVPLSRAREQYKAGQKFKATFEDFINGLMFYSEMLFWHNGIVYEVYTELKSDDIKEYIKGDCKVILCSKEIKQEYINVNEFRDNANIDGVLLKDIWDEVIHPCFMYCAEKESDYDFPPED